MSALWLSPLGPAGILLGGGTLLLLLQRHISDRLRQRLPIAITLLGMAAWLLLRWQPPGTGQWWLWQAPLGLETALGLQWDGWAWLTGWLLFLAALAALVLPQGKSRAGFTPPAFWILFLLAASLLVITAATWSALLSAWTLLLFFTGILAGTPADAAPRAWTHLLLAGLFLLLAPLFNGLGTLDAALSATTPLNLQAQLLVSLAVALVVGVYPFHGWLLSSKPRARGLQLTLHLLPALAAMHLLSRFLIPLLSSFSWIALGIAGLLGSAIAAWATEDDERVWAYVAINRATWALLALSLSRETGAYRSIFPLTALAITLMIWGLIARPQKPWRPYLALFFLMGFPFTPGFPLTYNLAQLATSVLGFPGWILILLAQTLLAAAVLRPGRRPSDEEETPSVSGGRGALWMLMLATAFGVWWGVSLASLLSAAGLSATGMKVNVFSQIRIGGLIPAWVTLLLPLLLGWALARWRSRIFAGLETWPQRIADITSLDWLEKLLGGGAHYISLAFGFAADILDGAGQFGWVLLALIIFWLFTH